MELTFHYHMRSRSTKYGTNAQSRHMDRIQYSLTWDHFLIQGMPTPRYFTRATQFNVTGVGEGAAECVKEVQMKSL
eukprot:454553-Karenia_brevis.AAC.1